MRDVKVRHGYVYTQIRKLHKSNAKFAISLFYIVFRMSNILA